MSQQDKLLNCHLCGLSCIAKEDKHMLFGYPCDFCDRPYCKNCLGVKTTTELRAVLLQNRTSIIWCPDCKKSNLNNLVKSNADISGEVPTRINSASHHQNEALQIEIQYLKKLLKEVEDKNNILKENNELYSKMVASLENDLQKQVNSATTINQHQTNPINFSSSADPSLNLEELLKEHTSRESRKKNFILFNCSEDVQDIKGAVIEVITQCSPDQNIPTNQLDVYRLGKKTDNKCRPIRVVCGSAQSALTVIRNSRKLKSNQILSHLSVSDDKTPRQLLAHREARRLLRERMDAGESNLRIVYRDGAPVIISSSGQNLNS